VARQQVLVKEKLWRERGGGGGGGKSLGLSTLGGKNICGLVQDKRGGGGGKSGKDSVWEKRPGGF